jgi:Spx/MgsR family transcriptional regulator
MKLFGIPNCDTVKKARTFLEKKKVAFEFVDFKKTPPTNEDIKRWAEAFGGLPVNKSGLTYKKHKDHFEGLAETARVEFLCSNSSMIKRPILEKNGKVLAFGFSEDQYKALLK